MVTIIIKQKRAERDREIKVKAFGVCSGNSRAYVCGIDGEFARCKLYTNVTNVHVVPSFFFDDER